MRHHWELKEWREEDVKTTFKPRRDREADGDTVDVNGESESKKDSLVASGLHHSEHRKHSPPAVPCCPSDVSCPLQVLHVYFLAFQPVYNRDCDFPRKRSEAAKR